MATNDGPPALRFRVVPGSDAAARRPPPPSQIPPPMNPSTHIAPRFHTRSMLIRQPMGQPRMPRNDGPMYQQHIRRGGPVYIRGPMVTRVLRPVNVYPPSSSLEDNKKKLVILLRTFLLRGSNMPDADLPQMIMSTEQYLKNVISTSAYIQMLQTNLKSIKDTLASFLDLYINAVRRDLQEHKISMDEIVPPTLVKSSHSQPNSVKSEPSPSFPPQGQRHSTSPMAQATKMETGSAGTSPAMPINSPQQQQPQFVFKICPGRVDSRERISPLTVSHNPSQLKSSPLPASEGYYSPPPVVAETSFQQYPDPQPMEETSLAPESPLPENDDEEMVCPPDVDQTQDDILRQSLINPDTFSAYLQKKMPGVTIEAPAFLMISEYLETRVRALIDTARSAAEHRSEQFRTNSDFVEVSNPRLQLKNMELTEKQRKINIANEKVSGPNKNDALKAARELAMLTKENEAVHHDAANEVAIAAIVGKKRKLETKKPDGNGPNAKKVPQKPRLIKQIAMKDVIYAFERDSFARESIVYRKALYGLYSNES